MSTFDLETPEIPVPEPFEKQEVKDELASAVKIAVIGAGQGGGRLAQCFYDLGYRRVCVINTATQDMVALTLPETSKMSLDTGGAAKDPSAAKRAFDSRAEDVLDFMRKSFGPVYDRTIVCIGAGGGTGAGTVIDLVRKAKELQITNKCSSAKVGVVLALPKITEGKKPNANAYWVLRAVMELVEAGTVAPLIVLDNERISSLYPGLAIGPFWHKANLSVCSIFNLFNTIPLTNSSYTSFDVSDWKAVLDSGLIVFGATPVSHWQEVGGISFALRDNLKRNILSGGVNLSTGSIGAAVVIASRAILNEVPHEHLDQAFDQLTRLLRPGSTVHRGIYSGSKDTMAVYTAIGGMTSMPDKLAELQRLGDILVTEKPGAGTVLGEHR